MNKFFTIVLAVIFTLWVGGIFYNITQTREVKQGEWIINSTTVTVATEGDVQEAFDEWVKVRPTLKRVFFGPGMKHICDFTKCGVNTGVTVMWDSFAYPDQVHEELMNAGLID